MDWALEGPKSSLTIPSCGSPQESRASHQNWSSYGNVRFCCLLAREWMCQGEAKSWEPRVQTEQGDNFWPGTRNIPKLLLSPWLLYTKVSTCTELQHLNMKHTKWLLNRGTAVPIKRATFAQCSLQQLLILVTNIPMYCWRLPGSGYHISVRYLALVQGKRVSPFRWHLQKFSCGKFSWAFWHLGKAQMTNCQKKELAFLHRNYTSLYPLTPPISLADFSDNNWHAHIWTWHQWCNNWSLSWEELHIVTSTGKFFLWELQIALHRFLKEGSSNFSFLGMQKPCSAQANIVSWVLTSLQNARDQTLCSVQYFYKTSVAEQGSKIVCNNQISVIKAF